ncbi:nucleotidyltransferase domain-containing protein [Geoglobus acetivorans]|uniref:Polymerase nucleotidyl transferase domain-containing protein n=1 Tax=Geoglobus acetivorans TaxID=565033 RepID=A0A0A7GJZ4_GEOAI|nr:hypothetical protein GACE_2251 [Geoglobus acetivorans]
MERIAYFKSPERFVREMKEHIYKVVKEFEIYIFGSAVRGDYSPGLSDIDVAIVSDEFKDRDKKLQVYDLLFEKYFHTPFEFHILTKRQWEFYRRFIGDDLVKV